MMSRKLGMLGGLFALVGVQAAVAGCSGAMGGKGGDPAGEKVASQSSALIPQGGDPTKPFAFPGTMDRTGTKDCEAAPTQLLQVSGPNSPAWLYPENYIAFPVLDHSGDDPYATAYSHYYSFAETSQGASLESDFFVIPNANGYKYEVALLSQTSILVRSGRELVLGASPKRWYLEGVNRADQNWLFYPPNRAFPPTAQPWCVNSPAGGCAPGQAFFDTNSHPPYGTDAVSADWLGLWNVAWAYSYTGDPYSDPNQPPEYSSPQSPYNSSNSAVESEHHECAFVYVCPGGTQSCDPTDGLQNHGCASTQSCTYDPNSMTGYNCWAPCYSLHNGQIVMSQTGASSLVPWDFFVAAERHDPGCCSF
jgi:hypothetical protein